MATNNKKPKSQKKGDTVGIPSDAIHNNKAIDSTNASGALNADYTRRVRPLIDLIDRLRAIGLDKDLGLPSIVVVGDQSTGKSSVLEAISGIQLPRGTDIVTRCPLELQLKKSEVEWKARIGYSIEQDQKLYNILNPEDIETRVRSAQDKLTNGATNVSDSLITLSVEGPDLPDLTLIDLPGIVRLDEKIGAKIRAMIKKHIEKKETIILAVIPANVDIATSEALALAREVDPKHQRTIGVMTKADLVAKGEEHTLLKVLRNESYFLEKGYIAVKCRGQKAISKNQSLKEALEEEEDFFAKTDYFQELPKETYGVPALSRRLTEELVEHIQNLLPDLKEQASKKRKATNDELRNMGEGIPDDDPRKTQYLCSILNLYIEKLRLVDDGREADGNSGQINLHNSARSAFGLFDKTIKTSYNQKYDDPTFKDDIKTALQRDRGYDLPHFFKFETFKKFIVDIVSNFSKPSFECLETVSRHVQKTLESLAHATFCRFTKLEGQVLSIISETLEKAEGTTRRHIENDLRMETLVFAQDEQFNIMFDDFVKQQDDQNSVKKAQFETLAQVVSPVIDPEFPEISSNTQHRQIKTMLTLTKTYMDIALRRISDNIPMIIRQHLMADLIEDLKLSVTVLSHKKSALDLLVEDRQIEIKRRRLHERSSRLEKATKELTNHQATT